jgi:hypothetical protein
MKASFSLSTVIWLFLWFDLHCQTATAPAAGDGSSGNPYQISSLNNLYWIAASDGEVPSPSQITRWAAYYLQTANIDASATSTWNSNGSGGYYGWSPIGNSTTKFSGSYNGGSYKINGLYINRPTTLYIGLFGYTNGASISYVGLEGGSVIGQDNVGALVGENNGSTSISYCYNTGTVSGGYFIGGLVGHNYNGTITGSINIGTIGNGIITSSGSYYVGGLVGHNNIGNVNNSYSTGAVSGYYGIGGLVGYNNTDGGTVTNCYSTGTITAFTGTIGGLYRYGGLVGDCCSGPVSNSYWDTESSGTTLSPSGQGTGKTTAEMKTVGTFLAGSWDFTLSGNLWAMNGTDNDGYPFIRWQGYTSSHIWLGGTTAWATTGNWSEGSLPTSSKNVIIPNLSNDPAIEANGSGDCQNLLLESGATLTVQSNATNNGSLIVSGTSSGNITYNRYMSGGTDGGGKWHLVSSPVGGQSINDLVVTNVASNGIATKDTKYGLATYNNSTPAWSYFTTSNIAAAGNFGAGAGYEILRTSDGTVTFTGSVSTSNVSIGITKPDAPGTAWNLIGNPYPSAINANSNAHATHNFLTENVANLNGSYVAVYVWDANAGTPAYVTINQSTAAAYIAPGQAFFVNSKDGGATVSIKEAMQTHQTGNIFKSGVPDYPTVTLMVTSSKGTTSTHVNYIANTTTGLDPGYDAGRFTGGNNSYAVYTRLVGDASDPTDFDIQCLPSGEFEHEVPVGLNAPENIELTFSSQVSHFNDTIPVFLEDRISGTITSIKESGSFYKATLSEDSQGSGRFFLHTRARSTGIQPAITVNEINILPYPLERCLRINGQVSEGSRIQLFDMRGRQLANRRLNENKVNELDMSGIKNGLYLIIISSENQRIIRKISWVEY